MGTILNSSVRRDGRVGQRGQTSALASLFGVILASWISSGALAAGSADADALHQTAVSTLDLTRPFKTKSKWSLVITQDPNNDFGERDEINFCFAKSKKTDCAGAGLNVFDSVQIIHPNGVRESPLLVARVEGVYAGSGHPVGTSVWIYRRESDRFERIFSRQSDTSENEETRVVTKGPLAGDIIVNTPTRRVPWSYAITVYRLSQSRHYAEILAYEARSRWADGNRLAVIDAEMLEIEKRLHVWRHGDGLPVPAEMPQGCGTITLRNGLEWCPGS
jgi:hypothetical protein